MMFTHRLELLLEGGHIANEISQVIGVLICLVSLLSQGRVAGSLSPNAQALENESIPMHGPSERAGDDLRRADQ